ncbi:HEAT repeat domain-containing protein [Pontiella sulfatireligans]|uniref:HEAT repeat domain-containing protein n=1 Tax=Pontiella sulfatireligans TaxID=2750658 RepID=A0A6C2UMM5_9BACT|nr:HEAT repeat domain-containing protein [Pontiella sulfatireligans]VGO21530.1 hypothetical protein SCARR_03604 [Pontiella sulfatireligans]
MTTDRKFKIAMLIMALTVAVLYGFGCRLIFTQVQQVAREAQASYGGEPVPALIALVEDEQALFEKRNTAIWALGQICDKRALPALQRLETSEIQHPPYDSTSYIVQYSIKKARKQINGFTVTRWMYRWL